MTLLLMSLVSGFLKKPTKATKIFLRFFFNYFWIDEGESKSCCHHIKKKKNRKLNLCRCCYCWMISLVARTNVNLSRIIIQELKIRLFCVLIFKYIRSDKSNFFKENKIFLFRSYTEMYAWKRRELTEIRSILLLNYFVAGCRAKWAKEWMANTKRNQLAD